MDEDLRPVRPDGRTEGDGTDGGGALVHRDGHRVRFLGEGADANCVRHFTVDTAQVE